MVDSHKIKTRMFELKLTQEDVAKNIGVDPATFNLKLNNNRRFYIDEVAKLCEILQINTNVELQEYFGLDFLSISNICENEKTGI